MLLRILDGQTEGDPGPTNKEIKALDHLLSSITDVSLAGVLGSARQLLVGRAGQEKVEPKLDDLLAPFLTYATWLESSPEFTLAEDVRESIERAQVRKGQRRHRGELIV